jgi:hypothetical protein
MMIDINEWLDTSDMIWESPEDGEISYQEEEDDETA